MEAVDDHIRNKLLETAGSGLPDAALLRSRLWTVFRYACLGGLERETGDCAPEQVAALFDELIALVGALRAGSPEGGPHV